jgi:tetratricopeptide (TPR) repeat protein
MEVRHRTCWLTAAVLAIAAVGAAPAAGQTGRIHGRVRDAQTGKAIKGATVTAENPQAVPHSFTAVSDDRGRFSMLGLRGGTWSVIVAAPGYAPAAGAARIQTLTAEPAMEFTLAPLPPPEPGPFDALDPADVQRELTAAAALMESQPQAAVNAYTAILTKLPALTTAHLQVGRAYRAQRDFTSALAAYAAIVPDDPAYPLAQLEIGLMELERGNVDAADRVLSQTAEAPGATAETFYALGEVKRAKALPDEAEGWYRKAAEAAPAWARPLVKLGLVVLGQGNAGSALAYLDRAIALDAEGTDGAEARELRDKITSQF